MYRNRNCCNSITLR